MKYKNADYRAREAHARTLVQTLAQRAGWTFTSRIELLPPVLWEGFYDPDAHLVVMGSAGDLPWGLKAGVGEARCTTLVAQPGFAMAGYVTCTFTLLRCAGEEVHWHSGLKVWADKDEGLFLVPDPLGHDPDGECFALEPRDIRPCTRPWSTPLESGHGLRRGEQILMLSCRGR